MVISLERRAGSPRNASDDSTGSCCGAVATRRWTYRPHLEPQAPPVRRPPTASWAIDRPHWSLELMGVPLDYTTREAARRDYAVLVRWWEAARPTCGHRGCQLDWASARPEFRRHQPAAMPRPVRTAHVVAVRGERDLSPLPLASA